MMKKNKLLKNLLNIYIAVGLLLMMVAFAIFLLPLSPEIYYTLNTSATENELSSLTQINSDLETYLDKEKSSDEVYLPPIDETLPKTNTLIIPRIDLEGAINEGVNPEEVLKNGIWRVNNFGTPEEKVPIILASHRFGYLSWDSDFRKNNSFYDLPKTQIGDKVIIIWNQRKYEYTITQVEEGTQISNYESDLILYTCKLFNSPIRIFRYAKLSK